MAKKRKASVLSGPTAKKVRIGDSSIIDEDEKEKFPSGRAKRESTGIPQYNFTRKRELTKKGTPKSSRSAKEPVAETIQPTIAKKRGRPPKDAGKAKTEPEHELEDLPAKPILKKRGRPAKSTVTEPPKKRGRPAKTAKADDPTKNSVTENTKANAKIGAKSPGAKRGRKPKAVIPAKNADLANANATPVSEDESKANGPNDTDATSSTDEKYSKELLASIDDKTQYWLMKAEPESRIEKGHDVKFSIDDLRDRQGSEPWDGVRNPAARNHMRAMRKGDLAFFYHSNCKIPGIAGVMRIAQEHSVDESAFDPKHPYYDAKSNPDKPTWELVHVEFVHKFEELITLQDLRKWGQKGGVLEGMQMLKQSRLSVSAVQPKEWRFILEQAGEDALLGIEREDGYESDVDGGGGDIAANSNLDEAALQTEPIGSDGYVNGESEATDLEADQRPLDSEAERQLEVEMADVVA